MSERIFDIVIVGGGGSGLSAAVEAAGAGVSVVVLEKAVLPGGMTGMSVGSLMAAGTRLQRAAGVVDSSERHSSEFRQILAARGLRTNEALLDLVTRHAGETVDLMQDLGVEFIGPMEQPPFATPRFYNALPGGRAYIARLLDRCRALGVQIVTATEAERLIVEANRITGVATPAHDYIARRGVIVASGDFSASEEMRGAHLNRPLTGAMAFNPTSTGDGHRMGLAAGAELVAQPDLPVAALLQARFAAPQRQSLLERLPASRLLTRAMRIAMKHLPRRILRPVLLRFAMTTLAPEPALFSHGAILVNRDGRRFTDETRPFAEAILQQPDRLAFIVFDRHVFRLFDAWPNFVSTAPGVAFAYMSDYARVRSDIFFRERPADALANAMAMEPRAFSDTVAATASTAFPLDAAHLMALGPVRIWASPTPVGMKVDDQLRVLRADGTVIRGLYAAGHAGQGGYLSVFHGHSLLWALTSGRLAGRYAAREEGGK